MPAFTASGSITTDWPTDVKSQMFYDNIFQGVVFPQAIPINMTLTGDFPTGFPVGVNIDILGPTDSTLLSGMSFPTPSRPRDVLGVAPPYCHRKNTKCLLNKDGNATLSAVSSAVFSNATAQTFLFYIFLPVLLPGWFDVNYRATFSFLDSYVLPDGTTVTNTFSGNVTWPAPFNFTVRKRNENEICDTLNTRDVNGTNVQSFDPFDPNNPGDAQQWFNMAATVNVNSAPSLTEANFYFTKDSFTTAQVNSPSRSLSVAPIGSDDPLNPTVVTFFTQYTGFFPAYPYSEKLKVGFEFKTDAADLVAYSLDNNTFRFVQGEEIPQYTRTFVLREFYGEPNVFFDTAIRSYYPDGIDLNPLYDLSTQPANWIELQRNTVTNLTVKLWSMAGNITTTRYFSLNYAFPDTDPTLDVFNIGNYQLDRPHFPINASDNSISFPPISKGALVLSLGKRVNSSITPLNIAASLIPLSIEVNNATTSFSGVTNITNGIAWVNIPIPRSILPLVNGPFKVVVTSSAQDAITFLGNGYPPEMYNAYRTSYTFNVYNGTTNSILAELNAGDGGRLTFNPYTTNVQQATFKPVAVNGVPTFPTILWTIGYANSFFNSAFGPQHPIFTLNGGNPIVTVDSNQILPYTTYPFGQNYVTIQVRETNYTVLLNITSSVSSINFQVSYDGTTFLPVDNVPAFDYTVFTTAPVAVNQSAVALRVVAVFDTNDINVTYAYRLNNVNQTGTISNSGSTPTLSLPGQDSFYILTLTAGREGSYKYNVSQTVFPPLFTNINSSVGALSPAFSASVTTYNLTVPYGTGNINLNALIDASSIVNADVKLTNINNVSDSTPVSAYTFTFTSGQAVLSGLNASLATDAYPLYVNLTARNTGLNRPVSVFLVVIRVGPRPFSTDSTLSALTSYPTDIAYVPSTTAYNVTLPYPETLFKVGGTTNDRAYARGVQVVAQLYNTTAAAVVSLISNTSLTLTAGVWQSANISAATANGVGLVVRVTVQVTAENGASSIYVLDVQLGTAPAVSSSSSSSSSSSTGGTGGGSNSTSSSSSSGTTSGSTGTTNGSTGTTGTTSGSTGTTSGSTGTTSGSTGTNSGSSGSNSNSTSSSSTGSGACIPGQAGCNSGFARAAVGAASPLAVFMAFMAILLLA